MNIVTLKMGGGICRLLYDIGACTVCEPNFVIPFSEGKNMGEIE
jgi:hypothetical protein